MMNQLPTVLDTPEETLISPEQETFASHSLSNRPIEERGLDLDECRKKVEVDIKEERANSTTLDGLSDSEKASIIKTENSDSRNVLLSAVYHKNADFLQYLFGILPVLGLTQLLAESIDTEHNSILHLAISVECQEILDMVWRELSSKFDEHRISSLLVDTNTDNMNAYALLIRQRKGHAWIKRNFIQKTSAFDLEMVCTSTVGPGVSTIMYAVSQNGLDIATSLIEQLIAHSPRNIRSTMQKIYMEQYAEIDSENSQQKTLNLMELLLSKVSDETHGEIQSFITLYVDSVVEDELYEKMTTPCVQNTCLFSAFITNNFIDIIAQLLNIWDFSKSFRDNMDKHDSESPFNRNELQRHPMSSQMIALFNNSPTKFYLTLSDHSKAKPQALLFYTEDHTAPHQKKMCRRGATQECSDISSALEDIGFDTHTLSGNNNRWKSEDLFRWLTTTLSQIGNTTSQLFVVGFTHGENGFMTDSDMEPIAICSIVSTVNEFMFAGIPITFIMQACRGKKSDGKAPDPGLKKHNQLCQSCAVGEESRRFVYTKEVAKEIRRGNREVWDIHHTASHAIQHHMDINLRSQTPAITSQMAKPKPLLLPTPVR